MWQAHCSLKLIYFYKELHLTYEQLRFINIKGPYISLESDKIWPNQKIKNKLKILFKDNYDNEVNYWLKCKLHPSSLTKNHFNPINLFSFN